MKQKLHFCAALLILIASLWAACNKPTPFGSELLEDELADYEFTDTLSIICTIETEDSLVTSDPSSTATAFLCGELDDEVFGKSVAEIFSLIDLGTPDPGFDTIVEQVDSIVMFLRYAPANVYGDTTVQQTVRVFRLDEVLDDNGQYYAHDVIPASTELGSVSFFPTPNKVDSLFDPDTKASFIRIPLDVNFGKELFRLDTAVLENDSAFYQAVRGVKIVASSGGTKPGAMLAFNLNNATYSRIRLYYHEDQPDTTILRHYDFYFSGANKFSHFAHDYAGSKVEPFINNTSDEFIYAQAMQGLRIKVEIPHVDRLDNIAVNKAQLVLTTASTDNGSPWLTSAQQLAMYEDQGDTTIVFTSDVLYSLGPAFNLGFGRFGGTPLKENVNGTLVERYRLTMSDKVQEMVDDVSGEIKNKTVYVAITPQTRNAQRSMFYGPKNATFPAKLELKYTRVK
jgi:hypothetical protein